MIAAKQHPENPVKGKNAPGSRGFSVLFFLFIFLVISGSWSCSSGKMPCPKMPKQPKDTAFKPIKDINEGDEINPNDNTATMTFGGGGFKRGKDGLVKKKKYKNLLSKESKNRRKYTKIKEPGSTGNGNHKYTKIKEPGSTDKGNQKYTKVKEPESKGKNQKYTKIKEPAGGNNANKKYTKIKQPN